MSEPLISILIPFHGDNPSALFDVLLLQASKTKLPVEFVLGDDASPGGPPEYLLKRLREEKSARLLSSIENLGRARMRNRLGQMAQGRYLLFLDADMLPDGSDFLAQYIAMCEGSKPEIVFGGISLLQTPLQTETRLHRALSLTTECLSASERSRSPAAHVFTSNLLVRRDIFQQCAFDDGFTGWGWEDIEWACRAGARFNIEHIDNSATHLGLYRDEALMTRYENSLGNFRRVIQMQPHAMAQMRLTRLSRQLANWQLGFPFQGILRKLALSRGLPLALRLFAFRLWRACLYSGAFDISARRPPQPHIAKT